MAIPNNSADGLEPLAWTDEAPYVLFYKDKSDNGDHNCVIQNVETPEVPGKQVLLGSWLAMTNGGQGWNVNKAVEAKHFS